MKTIILLITLAFAVSCNTKSGGGGSGIIVNHVPVADEFHLTTNLNTNYLNAQVISFFLSFPVDVTVTGIPKLNLTIGVSAVEASFVSSASNVLTFQYIVQPGDLDSDGISVSGTMNKNGGTVQYRGTSESSTIVVVPLLFSVRVNTANGLPPIATPFSNATLVEDIQKILTLPYSDVDGDQATACSLSSLFNVTITQACACAAGVCTVGVSGTANYSGAAGFNFTVTANAEVSSPAAAILTINAVDDASVTSNFSPSNFNEDTQGLITLSYSDLDSSATSCNVTNLSNVSITQACACVAGTCTVGVTGTPLHYYGAGSFDFTVTSGGIASNTSSATFSVLSVADAPATANLTPPNFNEDTQSIITLTHTIVGGDAVSSCALTSLSNVTITQGCACAAGVCTVGVTGALNYNGLGSFNWTVSSGPAQSISRAANFTILSVDDLPVTSNFSPANFNEDNQGLITLSYVDVDHQASVCSLSNLANVTITQPCACAGGVCTAGVSGSPTHYNGAGSFDFTVTAGGVVSNTSAASFSIISVLDAPTTANITPANFNEDTQSIITLTHTVVGGDTATSCAVTGLSNVTVTQACACAVGVCTVGVTGGSNYFGAGSFNWTVSAGTAQSVSRSATFNILSVEDVAVLGAIGAQSTNKNTATSAIAFTFSDGDGAACNGTRLSMTSSDTAVVANASVVFAGIIPNCTAVITPMTNATGPTTITITATDGGLPNKTTSFTLTVYGSHLVWLEPGNAVITLYDFLTPGGNTNVTLKVKNVGNQSTPAVIVMSNSNVTPRIEPGATTCTAVLAAGTTCDVTVNWINTGGGGNGLKIETYTATAGAVAATVTVQGTK